MPLFFLILITLSFWGGNLFRWQFNNGYAISLLDISVGVTGVWILVKQNKHIFTNSYSKPFFALCLLFLLSLLSNIPFHTPFQLLQGFSYIIRFVFLGLLLFFPKQKRISFFLHLIGGGTVILALIQYCLYPALRNLYYLGWDEHLYRAFGTFLDPNFLGIFLGLYLLFLLHDFLSKSEQISTTRRILLTTFLVITPVALFLTFSRESYLITLVGIGVYLAISKRFSVKLLSFAGIFLATIIILFLLFGAKSEGTRILRTASIAQRFQSDVHALLIFAKSPAIGVGYNLYRFAQEKEGYLDATSADIFHAGAGPENSYLLVLATAGIVGILVYGYFWKRFLTLQLKNKEKSLLISSSVLYLLSGLFINSLFYPLLLVWYFLLLNSYYTSVKSR